MKNDLEQEYKFIVINDRWKQSIIDIIPIQQWYIYKTDQFEIRLRMEYPFDKPIKTTITSKTTLNHTNTNLKIVKEYEDELQYSSFQAILNSDWSVEYPNLFKIRNLVNINDVIWSVDDYPEFKLTIAELEVNDTNQQIRIPDWLGANVSNNKYYSNYYLAKYKHI